VHGLETVGTQEYELKPAPLTDRLATAYGEVAAAEVGAHLAS
jgi:adenosine kinase